MAVGRRYKDRVSGEWKDDVAFVPCTVWRESAERCGQRLKKGSPIFIEGRLRSKEWQTKEGQKRVDLEVEANRIQFLESFGDSSGAPSAGTEESFDESSSAGPSSQPVGAVAGGHQDAPQSNDDEVPF